MDRLQVVERERGGWLAIGEAVPAITIAVEGEDEPGAREAFAAASSHWRELDDAAKLREQAEVPSE
jgi:hypothetical protein